MKAHGIRIKTHGTTILHAMTWINKACQNFTPNSPQQYFEKEVKQIKTDSQLSNHHLKNFIPDIVLSLLFRFNFTCNPILQPSAQEVTLKPNSQQQQQKKWMTFKYWKLDKRRKSLGANFYAAALTNFYFRKISTDYCK